jgi:hypothetical protein
MKTTITVKETTTTTREVAVLLPLFTKVVTDYFIDYYAIYDAGDNQKNMTFTLLKATEKLFKLNCFADIKNAIAGENISQSEFASAFIDVTEEIISKQVHMRATITNDTQGDYYINEQEQLLNSHE